MQSRNPAVRGLGGAAHPVLPISGLKPIPEAGPRPYQRGPTCTEHLLPAPGGNRLGYGRDPPGRHRNKHRPQLRRSTATLRSPTLTVNLRPSTRTGVASQAS